MDLGYPELNPNEHSVVFAYTAEDGDIDFEVTNPVTVWRTDTGGVDATYFAADRINTVSQTLATVIPDSLSEDDTLAVLNALRDAYDEQHGISFLDRLAREIDAEE